MVDSSGQQYSSAYAIFEGGGAKGLAHVGALKALEDERLALVGVAGTSAGAIIAALVAVGYRAEEIFESAESNILVTLGLRSPVDLLGRRQWNNLRSPRRQPAAIASYLLLGLGLLGLSLILKLTGLRELLGSYFYVFHLLGYGFLLLGIFGICSWLLPLFRQQGILDTGVIREVVNQALKEKLAQHYKDSDIRDPLPEDVLFGHIDPTHLRQCIPLKIVATNVSTGELTLFDSHHPEVPVADAVAASAAVPFVFRPAQIPSYSVAKDSLFADGGLVSNLPSWTFRDDKKSRERLETRDGVTGRIPVFAFALEETRKSPDELRAPALGRSRLAKTLPYFRQVLVTGVFGGQRAIQDFVSDLRIITLKTDLTTLDFDCTAEEAKLAVESGRKQAAAYLRIERLRDALTNKVLDQILATAKTEINKRRTGRKKPRLRVALIDPVCPSSEFKSVGFKVVAGAGMSTDSDDALELDLRGTIAAAAFRDGGQAVYGLIGNESAGELWMTKYERALLPQNLHSVIAIPIYAQPEIKDRPRRVLTLDSSDALQDLFNDPGFMDMLTAAGAKTSRTLINEALEALDHES